MLDALREQNEEHLRTQTLPGLRRIEGYQDAYVLRRQGAEGVEFLVLTLWASIDAVRVFAVDDYEASVIPSEARGLLDQAEERVRHYEVAIGPSDAAQAYADARPKWRLAIGDHATQSAAQAGTRDHRHGDGSRGPDRMLDL